MEFFNLDAAFDHQVRAATDQHEMFHIVTTHEKKLAAVVHVTGGDYGDAPLRIASAHPFPIQLQQHESPVDRDKQYHRDHRIIDKIGHSGRPLDFKRERIPLPSRHSQAKPHAGAHRVTIPHQCHDGKRTVPVPLDRKEWYSS